VSNLLKVLKTKEDVINWAFNRIEFAVNDAKWIFKEKALKHKVNFERKENRNHSKIKVEIEVY